MTGKFLAQYWPGGPAGVDAQAGAPVKWEIGDAQGRQRRLAARPGRPEVPAGDRPAAGLELTPAARLAAPAATAAALAAALAALVSLAEAG